MEMAISKPEQNTTTKDVVVSYLQEISNYYRETLIGLFIARLEGKHDTQLTINFNSYVSTIITVYKIIKPKLSTKNEEHKELIEIIEAYLDNVLKENKNVDVDTIISLFRMFNFIEDSLRSITNSLGYTADEVEKL